VAAEARNRERIGFPFSIFDSLGFADNSTTEKCQDFVGSSPGAETWRRPPWSEGRCVAAAQMP
jgi:hypothetical protein